MTFVTLIIFLFYICWITFSVLAQGENRLNRRIKELDLLNLIPNYHFFCPHPMKVDFHLYFRYQYESDEWGEWEELKIGERIPQLCFIWNPTKRERKLFYKMVRNIKRKESKSGNGVKTRSYRSLLNYIHYHKWRQDVRATQIKITKLQDLNPHFQEEIIFSVEERTTRIRFHHDH